jgi:RNA polymerase sigma-70 factor, ECF subfamily
MVTQSRLLKRLLNPANEVDWEAAYAEHLPRVFNYFRYRFGDDALAEDLTQATFEKAWKSRQRYRSDLAAFSTWLFSIARNLATDHLRSLRDELSLEEAHPLAGGEALEEAVERRQDLRKVAALLKRLPERERELVALKYGAGLNNRVIAAQTGLTETNVGTILNRAVAKLRGEWEADP